MYPIQTIAEIINARLLPTADVRIEDLVYDSRRIQQPQVSLFFALKTSHADGHRFIQQAYKAGVRAFVVSEATELKEAAVFLVEDTLQALQDLAVYHRRQFQLPVIGITGSNGKTVVKEWLNSLLETDYKIVRSPKSFNSQLGVALSVWDINGQHNLGIFEAGISSPGEMEKLERMIRPTIGVLTNIGEAHSEGFASDEEKLKEKLKLFSEAEIIIGQNELLNSISQKKITWSYKAGADLSIESITKTKTHATLKAVWNRQPVQLQIPFTDDASIENAITCWCVLLYLGKEQAVIQERFSLLHSIDMRLQLNHAINDCMVINDSYSADPTSLKIALDFLRQQSSGLKRTAILSDFFESGKTDKVLYEEIAHLLQTYKIEKLVAIGDKIGNELKADLGNSVAIQSYPSTEAFIQSFKSSGFINEIILLKGARKFGFEKIAALFEEKRHGTVLQINLAALTHNLKAYQKLLRPSTKVMAMVKAFSYGSGGAEIAAVLQFNNLAYLGVAYADEGIELVKDGISIPVMVMNAEPSAFSAIVENNLQPVIYSTQLLYSFENYIREQRLSNYPVHLEIETGMNRLGFQVHEIDALAGHLATHSYLKVESVFSHLAGSEDPAEDGFTNLQTEKFEQAVSLLKARLTYPFLKHISNSAAIVRHPHLQMDMVRLGIGLYGVETGLEGKLDLQPVATLRSTVAQIKEVKKGESVSYNRRGVVQRDSRIATVRIGYADGYSRRLGNGVGKMMIRGQSAPVIGTVCMDMTMIDVTDIDGVTEGDDVIVFGNEPTVQQIALWSGTIPYEIMTSVSQRVKRVYYE